MAGRVTRGCGVTIDPLPSSVGWSLVLIGALLVILVVLAVVARRLQHEIHHDPHLVGR